MFIEMLSLNFTDTLGVAVHGGFVEFCIFAISKFQTFILKKFHLKVRIALELKGIEYEYKSINLIKDGGEQVSSILRFFQIYFNQINQL